MKILIVEKNPQTLTPQLSKLKELHVEVTTVSSGEAAIETVTQASVDLALICYELPGLNGFDTSKRLRELAVNQWFPIVVLTESDTQEHLLTGIQAGVDDFITTTNPILIKSRVSTLARLALLKNQQAKTAQELENNATIDSLTASLNQRGFLINLGIEWRRMFRDRSCMSCLSIRINGFDTYVQRHGEARGDECIQAIANAIMEGARRPGDHTAHLSLSEFCTILTSTDVPGALCVANRISGFVSGLTLEHGQKESQDPVSVSIGIACSDQEEVNSEEDLLELAEKAMLATAEKGNNSIKIYNAGL